MTKDLKMLGLGSILTLNNKDGKYIVIARAVKKMEADKIIPCYKVALHPFGDSSTHESSIVQEDDIDQVIFEGYFDDEDTNFAQELVSKLSNVKAKPKTEAKVKIKDEVVKEAPVESQPSALKPSFNLFDDDDSVSAPVTPVKAKAVVKETETTVVKKDKQDPFYKFR